MKRIQTLITCLLITILLIPNIVFAQEQVQTSNPSTTYHIYFCNIITGDGEILQEYEILTDVITPGISHGKGASWFINNQMSKYSFYKGEEQEWTFTKVILKEDGTELDSSIQMTYQEGVSEVFIYLYPQYNIVKTRHLLFDYIDNISTGTGSWSNGNSIIDYTHTFDTPESQPGYKFIEWKNFETEESYTGGESVTVLYDSLPEDGSLKNIVFYAVWQPSVIINWYDEGELLNTIESFDESIPAYSVIPEATQDLEFLEWQDAEDNPIASDTEYAPPEQTIEPTGSLVINLYAVYKEPEPEPEPEPTVTPDPEPTVTPEPEPEPTVEPDPTPTVEPEPEPTEEPTIKPEPDKKECIKPERKCIKPDRRCPRHNKKECIKPDPIEKQEKNTAPKTGDNSKIFLYIIILIIAIGTIIGILIHNKKK